MSEPGLQIWGSEIARSERFVNKLVWLFFKNNYVLLIIIVFNLFNNCRDFSFSIQTISTEPYYLGTAVCSSVYRPACISWTVIAVETCVNSVPKEYKQKSFTEAPLYVRPFVTSLYLVNRNSCWNFNTFCVNIAAIETNTKNKDRS